MKSEVGLRVCLIKFLNHTKRNYHKIRSFYKSLQYGLQTRKHYVMYTKYPLCLKFSDIIRIFKLCVELIVSKKSEMKIKVKSERAFDIIGLLTV